MRTLRRALLLGLSALAVGLAVNQRHPEGVPWNLLSSSLSARTPWMRISTDSAAALFAAEGTAFVDIRPNPEFAVDHIPGALNLPFHPFFLEFGRFEKTHSKDRMVVFYCFEPVCREGRSMLRLMRRRGYTKAVWLYGGLSRWIADGHPVETGGGAP